MVDVGGGGPDRPGGRFSGARCAGSAPAVVLAVVLVLVVCARAPCGPRAATREPSGADDVCGLSAIAARSGEVGAAAEGAAGATGEAAAGTAGVSGGVELRPA